ncbi:hypothetical protein Ahu01nite_026170 [Winogradskya humida]|uniref:Uncharacterized protein n=1 Tax=Winogradskya humida TaxID=113566 RepID=A0ABQ3ZLQ2_9ACTN|nr:hypothetical protein Ahu01nite_026170 [Actinoplanes humidus]
MPATPTTAAVAVMAMARFTDLRICYSSRGQEKQAPVSLLTPRRTGATIFIAQRIFVSPQPPAGLA